MIQSSSASSTRSRFLLHSFLAGLCLGSLLALPAPAEAAKYKLLIRSADIDRYKLDGGERKPWDVDVSGGRPDPYVILRIDGNAVFLAPKASNTYSPRWHTGPGYYELSYSTPISVSVVDADIGKALARVGVAGVSLREDLSYSCKRFINDLLLKVETDDLIGRWSGRFGDLLKVCGKGRDVDIMSSRVTAQNFSRSSRLRSLRMRIIERPSSFDLEASSSRDCLALTSVRVQPTKRRLGVKWDVGLGAARSPDLRYMIFVNGSAAMTGGINKDSLVGMWSGDVPKLNLYSSDIISIAVLDADLGTALCRAGRHALLFSRSLSRSAKVKLFHELSTGCTDDLVYLWVGTFGELRRRGSRFSLPTTRGGSVWVNDGLTSIEMVTRPQSTYAGKPVQLVVRSGSVASKKSNNTHWDIFRGKPDLYAKCYVADTGGGWHYLGKTSSGKNALSATWNLRLTSSRLLQGKKVKIDVYDEDPASDDLAGTILFTIPFRSGSFDARGGQVTRVSYEIR